jgi:tRNA (guanine-N7-)-methyltransferase
MRELIYRTALMTRGPLLRPQPVGQELVGLENPPDWKQLFGFDGPLELEIGSGLGHFALEYAARHPHVRYVAFEWRKKYAREVAHKGELRGLANFKMVEGDARLEVPRIFTPGVLSGVHFQFPDPWWKRSHHKRAVLQPDFAALLFTFTASGGFFEMRTDVEDRAHQMLATLEAAGYVNPLGPGVFHPRAEDDVPSTRERRYLTSGEPVYRATVRKP